MTITKRFKTLTIQVNTIQDENEASLIVVPTPDKKHTSIASVKETISYERYEGKEVVKDLVGLVKTMTSDADIESAMTQLNWEDRRK